MTTFVMLATLASPGIRGVKSNPGRINAVSGGVERLGVSVVQQSATPGEFDLLSIAEAPDDRAMLPLAIERDSRGTPTAGRSPRSRSTSPSAPRDRRSRPRGQRSQAGIPHLSIDSTNERSSGLGALCASCAPSTHAH